MPETVTDMTTLKQASKTVVSAEEQELRPPVSWSGRPAPAAAI